MPDLITITDVREITGLNSLVEERKLKAGIEDAHRAMKKVLGLTGYALVYATPGNFIVLVLLLKPWLAWSAREMAMPEMLAEADRGGIFKKGGQDYTPVSARDYAMLTNAARGRAESRLEDVIHHLINNASTYTWYGINVDGEERINNNTKVAGGISFRRATGQDPYRG